MTKHQGHFYKAIVSGKWQFFQILLHSIPGPRIETPPFCIDYDSKRRTQGNFYENAVESLRIVPWSCVWSDSRNQSTSHNLVQRIFLQYFFTRRRMGIYLHYGFPVDVRNNGFSSKECQACVNWAAFEKRAIAWNEHRKELCQLAIEQQPVRRSTVAQSTLRRAISMNFTLELPAIRVFIKN